MVLGKLAQRVSKAFLGDDTRLLMTLLVRNEQDILPHVLEYHRKRGVDHFIVTDNLSEDRTPKILRHYENLGWLTLINETNDDYDQQAWVTRMARMAAEPSYSADWIIHSDADEFWVADDKDLKTFFSNVDPAVNIISAQRHDFVCLRPNEQPWHDAMVYRKAVSLSPRGTPLPPKIAHRPNPQVNVLQGNHAATGFDDPVISSSGMEILHFPMRSQQQIENKIRKGGAAYERNTVLPKTVAVGWRRLYEELKKEGSLKRYYDENSCIPEEAGEMLENGELIIDNRIRDFFETHQLSWQG